MLTESNIIQSQFQFANIEHNEKQQLKKNRLKRQSKKKQNDKPKGFYYNIQVIRKVATFLQNVKSGAVREQVNLKPQDLAYLSNQNDENPYDQNLFRYGNKFIVIVEIIVFFASLYCLWKNSYELIFGRFQQIQLTSIPALFIQIFYKIVYFNTEQRNQKLQIISKRKEILKNYLKQFALFDFFYFLGYTLEYVDNIYVFYPSKMLGLCIFVTFSAIYGKLENIFARTPTIETMMSLIKLLLKIIVFIHFLSLMFNLLTIVEKYNGIDLTWVQHNFDEELTSFEKYINAWYWGTTILSTVGFGDITPANVYERAFFSFVQVFCCAMFGYCVNYIGTMIGVFGQSKATYQKDIRRLNYYLKTVKIPQKLKNQIRSHFYNKYQIEQVYSPESEQYLFKKFTEKITKDVKQNNNLNIIQQSKTIKLFSEETRQKLAGFLNKVVYAPSELVFEQHTAKNKLCIIQDGQINEIPINKKYNKKVKPLYTFSNQNGESKNTLGWFNFITGEKYKTCAKASKFSITYELLRDDFLRVIKCFKNDYYKFLQTKEKFIFNPCISVKQCVICGRLTHNVSHCSRIHFIPKRISSLILHEKKNSTRINFRKYYKRQIKRKSKLHYSVFEDQIDEIIQNNIQNSPFISKKRISVDRAHNLISTKNRHCRFNSGLSQDIPFSQQKRLQSIVSSSNSLQSLYGYKEMQSKLKYSVIDQIQFERHPKEQQLKKIQSIMFDETQYYFPNSFVGNILAIMQSIQGKGRKCIQFISQPKTMSIKFTRQNKYAQRPGVAKLNISQGDQEV